MSDKTHVMLNELIELLRARAPIVARLKSLGDFCSVFYLNVNLKSHISDCWLKVLLLNH